MHLYSHIVINSRMCAQCITKPLDIFVLSNPLLCACSVVVSNFNVVLIAVAKTIYIIIIIMLIPLLSSSA